MLSRINLFGIVCDHLRTLRRYDSSSNRISIEDLFLFIIFPLIVSIILVIRNITLDSHVTDLITSISILGGFLFNLLAIIYGLMDKVRDSPIDPNGNSTDAVRERIRQRFIKEIHVNISFNIVISLLTLSLLLIYSYMIPIGQPDLFSFHQTSFRVYIGLYLFISILIYFLLGLFSLTMLMIINRVYIILNKG